MQKNKAESGSQPTVRVIKKYPNRRLYDTDTSSYITLAEVKALLQAEGLQERRVAVEVNGEIVPRSRHAEWALVAGDRVEIVHALGGG